MKTKEYKGGDSMSKQFPLIFILILSICILSPQIIMGYGVPSGTIITNARDLDLNDIADNPGEVVGSYTNTGGYTNYASANNITVSTVSAGYDLSVINTPANGSGGPGTAVDYTYYVTNHGNVSAQMTVRISSNAIDPAWGASSYELWTNFGGGYGQLAGSANFISNQLISIAADTGFELRVRVNIPGGASDGSTNEVQFDIWDPQGSAGAGTGDTWPGAGAILPATSDVANARDYQTDLVLTSVSGPVIQLTKSVNVTSARPYEILTYTIRYTNVGSASAYNVTIDDAIYTNFVRLMTDSAETNSGSTHNPTNYYYISGTWQDATQDAGNENNLTRVRWVLQSPVLQNGVGTLEFKVRIE